MAKSKYDEYVLPKLFLIECWARDGLIDEQIAKNLGVAYSTFKDYKNKHLALSDALKRGKEVVDCEVENTLLKRAMGYSYTETTSERIGEQMVVTKQVVKEVQPDTTALIFWLKNRKPDKWRDKQEIDNNQSGTIDVNIKVI